MFGWFKRQPRSERSFESWRHAELFLDLTPDEFASFESEIDERSLEPGELLVEEGDPATHLFVILRGRLSVLKRELGRDQQHCIARLGGGDVVGEMALLDAMPRSASVKADTAARVVALPFAALTAGAEASAAKRSAFHKIVMNLAGILSARLRTKSLESAQSAQRRVAMGRFIINVLILLCAYIVLLSGLDVLARHLPSSSTYISLPMQLIFAWGSWKFIRGTGYPLREFGLGLTDLFGSILEATLFTVPFLGLVTGLKWLILQSSDKYAAVPLIEHPDVLVRFGDSKVQLLLIIYAVSSLVQELIVRGALQSTLESFLVGENRVRNAILVSALVFSVNHLHMSFLFAVLAFIPGVFWGWLFSRRRNLAGVTLSHVTVGAFVFFVLGANLPS